MLRAGLDVFAQLVVSARGAPAPGRRRAQLRSGRGTAPGAGRGRTAVGGRGRDG
ncbi:hypothetical protein [Streptomyces sp. OE57]|uniref:hypothetical protein n=1 Tax=Streptomyces lacaronensis TaxID=3379885 RepID=UPI0039B751F6